MVDYLITCDTFGKATSLMEKFIYLLHDTNELKKVDRVHKTVYLDDGSSYRFTKRDRRYTDGYHGKVFGELTFTGLMKAFQNGTSFTSIADNEYYKRGEGS